MLLKLTNRVLCVILLIGVGNSLNLYAQTPDSIKKSSKYPFIRHEINNIDNNIKGLNHFYRQLDLLKSGKRRSVNIVHIGDSHIQADWFSGEVRKMLQSEFGSAGRGLVFPYRVARTNSPPDITSYSNVTWLAKRNVSAQKILPIGISGMTIKTNSSDFVLKLGVQGNENKFNKITLFTEKGPLNYNLKISSNPNRSEIDFTPSSKIASLPLSREELEYHEVSAGESLGLISDQYHVSISNLKKLNKIEGSTIYVGQKLIIRKTKLLDEAVLSIPESGYQDYASVATDFHSSAQFVSTVYLPEAVNTIFLRGDKTIHSQNKATLYGMVLENYEQSGILYHTVGVNGARFQSYNNSSILFLEQLQVLKPDLIIISLGTNETANKWFNSSRFFDHLDTFIHSLEQSAPHANILFTTPPDALRARQYENQHISEAKDILLNYALSNDLALWNFYDVMGGMESIRNWYKSGLAQKDHLHLTKSGYELQGKLLFEALINGYGSYRAER